MRRRGAGIALLIGSLLGSPATAQSPSELTVRTGNDVASRVPILRNRGFAAVPVSALAPLGWRMEWADGRVLLTQATSGARLDLRDGSPFFHLGSAPFQLADAPYLDGGELLVPIQLLSDVLADRLGYAFDPATFALAVPAAPSASPTALPRPAAPPSPTPAPVREAPVAPRARPAGEARVVVIDAGHGGRDPGTVSRTGFQEKTVALAVARVLARELRKVPGLEVHMTRDSDVLVPLWDRGSIATAKKGERPGVFISLHANAFASDARGFETYFLSEARTDHERRVSEIENAPLRVYEDVVEPDDDLGFILRELRNLDHQHWSALLAELVQQEVGKVHPGPDRGVKQGPLAVITNSLMPSVLVEIGYLSHPTEARLLADPAFQELAGHAIARAVTRFFERYPPGTGGGVGPGR